MTGIINFATSSGFNRDRILVGIRGQVHSVLNESDPLMLYASVTWNAVMIQNFFMFVIVLIVASVARARQ